METVRKKPEHWTLQTNGKPRCFCGGKIFFPPECRQAKHRAEKLGFSKGQLQVAHRGSPHIESSCDGRQEIESALGK